MNTEKLLHLISGTDIRGTAVGADNELTDEVVICLVEAFTAWLKEEKNIPHPQIAVGYDSRVSASRIFMLVKKAILSRMSMFTMRIMTV